MTQDHSIIGVVKELQERCINSKGKLVAFTHDKHVILKKFPSIAHALLTKEEQLRIALEALNHVEFHEKDTKFRCLGCVIAVKNALSRIRCLTLP